MNRLGVIKVLEAHEGLHEKRLGELEVDVHDGDHCDASEHGAQLGEWSVRGERMEGNTYKFGGLCEVIVADSGRDEFTLFLRLGARQISARHASETETVPWVRPAPLNDASVELSAAEGFTNSPYLSTVWSFFFLI